MHEIEEKKLENHFIKVKVPHNFDSYGEWITGFPQKKDSKSEESSSFIRINPQTHERELSSSTFSQNALSNKEISEHFFETVSPIDVESSNYSIIPDETLPEDETAKIKCLADEGIPLQDTNFDMQIDDEYVPNSLQDIVEESCIEEYPIFEIPMAKEIIATKNTEQETQEEISENYDTHEFESGQDNVDDTIISKHTDQAIQHILAQENTLVHSEQIKNEDCVKNLPDETAYMEEKPVATVHGDEQKSENKKDFMENEKTPPPINSIFPLYNSAGNEYTLEHKMKQDGQMQKGEESILATISHELAALRNDIVTIKSEFDRIKTNDIRASDKKPFEQITQKNTITSKTDFSCEKNKSIEKSTLCSDYFCDIIPQLDEISDLANDIPNQIDDTFANDNIPIVIEHGFGNDDIEQYIPQNFVELQVPVLPLDDNNSAENIHSERPFSEQKHVIAEDYYTEVATHSDPISMEKLNPLLDDEDVVKNVIAEVTHENLEMHQAIQNNDGFTGKTAQIPSEDISDEITMEYGNTKSVQNKSELHNLPEEKSSKTEQNDAIDETIPMQVTTEESVKKTIEKIDENAHLEHSSVLETDTVQAIQSDSTENQNILVEEKPQLAPIISDNLPENQIPSSAHPAILEVPQTSNQNYIDDEEVQSEEPTESLFQSGQWDSEPAKTDSLFIPATIKNEMKNVLVYMDKLLENLPEEKIQEFARSEHFETYKNLFQELGLS